MTLFACTDEYEEAFVPEQTKSVQVVNGMLVFSSSDELSKVLNGNEGIMLDNYVSNFVSQQDLFDEVIAAERKNMDILNSLEGEALEKAPKHSKKYEEYLQNGIIRKVLYNDGSSSYDVNLCVPVYAQVVNREGFFAIQDTIIQITEDKVKVWSKGNPYDSDYLSRITENAPEEGIVVYDFSKNAASNSRAISFPAPPTNVMQGVACSWVGRNDRQVMVFYDNTGIADMDHYTRDLYVRVFGQEKINGTNSYNYVSFRFTLAVEMQLDIDNVIGERFTMRANGSGSNVWYTIYPMFKILSSGKQQQTTDAPYAYILFWRGYMTRIGDDGNMDGQIVFSLKRGDKNNNFQPILDYDPIPGMEGTCYCEWLTEIPE